MCSSLLFTAKPGINISKENNEIKLVWEEIAVQKNLGLHMVHVI